MKNALLTAVVLLVLATAAAAHAATTVVYPTGAFPTDVNNVQAAVDQGGTVLLKATDAAGTPTSFNFGPPVVGSGRVLLTRDVELVGEHLASGVTTIEGGSLPFMSFDAIKSVIRGIRFERPLRGAAWFFGPPGADTELVDNTVVDVVGRFFHCCGTFAEALLVQGGRVRIAGNVVDGINSETGIGISQFFSTGPIEIVGNRISATSDVGIGIQSSANDGPARILDNVIKLGPLVLGDCCGRGIEITGTGSYLVTRNEIVVEDPSADGILGFGTEGFGFGPLTGAVIVKNDIALRPGRAGVAVGGIASDSYIGQNRIVGTALAALVLYDTSQFEPNSDVGFNTLVGNNIARVDSSFADVFLDVLTHDTVLKGDSGTVIDLGTNNRVTGFSPGGPGTGQQLREAVKRRNDALKAARADPHARSSADLSTAQSQRHRLVTATWTERRRNETAS